MKDKLVTKNDVDWYESNENYKTWYENWKILTSSSMLENNFNNNNENMSNLKIRQTI